MAAEHTFDFDFNDQGLKGQTFILSGGSGGLGSASSYLLARDGAALIVGYRSNRERAEALREELQSRFGTIVELIGGDIGEATVRERLIQAVKRIGYPLGGLVCFTGDPARVKFDQASETDLQASMGENYIAPILLARAAAEEMQSSSVSGSIVLFSTMQAIVPFESSINYAGPKVALVHAARIMAKQWGGPSGIRVNVIAPGVNRAGMALQSISSGKYDFFVEKAIIPRFGRPEDTARVVRLLVEPDNYLTGQVITVDGGLTLRRDIG